ncbi:MAG: DMT family transporter [Streptosporangiaceae bacterium]
MLLHEGDGLGTGDRSADPRMISYVLAFLGALVNATGNVLNRKVAQTEPSRLQFRLRLLTDLMHKPAWLAAVGMMIISFALAAAALGTGQLASVQLIVTLELPMTIIGSSWLLGTRLSRREWVAIAVMTAGVIGILALLDPRPGPARPIAAILWILPSAANAGILGVFFLAAKAHSRPATRACLLGLAAGLGYGLTAAYTKGMADEFNAGGFEAVVSSWQLYACASAGVLSTWLLENAYQAGPLTASQPGITLVDPVISTLWGVIVFGEKVNSGIPLALTPIPLLAVAAGVLILSRSHILRATGPATPVPGHAVPDEARFDHEVLDQAGEGPDATRRRAGGKS